MQAIYFSIPGILTGLLSGWLLYLIVAAFIANFVDLPIDSQFTTSAVVAATLLGFFMPVVANIFPIRVCNHPSLPLLLVPLPTHLLTTSAIIAATLPCPLPLPLLFPSLIYIFL